MRGMGDDEGRIGIMRTSALSFVKSVWEPSRWCRLVVVSEDEMRHDVITCFRTKDKTC